MQESLSKKRQLNCEGLISNSYLYAFSLILVLVIYFLAAYNAIPNLDYFSINGTFQNYNVIRRFLDGQIPFKDFTVYLGSGHLVLTSLFTFLFGGNYAASVLAYDYVSSLSVILYCYGLSYAFFKKNWVIPAITSLVFRLFLSIFLKSMMVGGNSARNIRAMIIPVCIVIFVVVSTKLQGKEKWSEKKRFYAHIILVSLLAGLSIVWGNDYGLVCFIAFVILVPLLVLIKYKNIPRLLLTVVIMLSLSLVTMFFLAALITRGHPIIWVKMNFFYAQYQGWYYEDPYWHAFYFYQIEISPQIIMCAVTMLAYVVFLLRNLTWKGICAFGTVVFVLLSCFGAVQGYKLFSRIDTTYSLFLIETLLLIYFLEAFRVIGYFLKKNKVEPNKTTSIIFTSVAALFICFGLVFCLIKLPKDNSNYKYYPELGGYLDECSEDLDKSVEILNGRRVFSAYASSLETVTDQYQPSGTDYIIHVLSDDAREKYLESFNKKDFEVVSTSRLDYSIYGKWMRNANWFFYRELYANYHVVDCNTYAAYWEQGANQDTILTGDFPVTIERLSDHEVVVKVDMGDSTVNGVADVYISFSSEVGPNKSSLLMLRHLVGVEDPNITDGSVNLWTLRPESTEYVPITIVEGKGCLVFSSYPNEATVMNVESATCDRIFTDDFA